MKLEAGSNAEELMNALKSKYLLEILEYDKTGASLDNTVFYIRFATELRKLIGEKNDSFLMRMLSDGDHIAQELANRKKDAKIVFDKILATGRRLAETAGRGFYADVQRITLTEKVELFCFQPPCGGNIYVLQSDDAEVMVDSGFGLYHEDAKKMMEEYGLLKAKKLAAIYVTHADADHAGAAGHFAAKTFMHNGSKKVIDEESRAWGTKTENSVLEDIYTRLINIFSKFAPPKDPKIFGRKTGEEGIFSVIGSFTLADMKFEVLESLGGHVHGQVFYYSRDPAVLFTGDSLINFESLSAERKEYNMLAVDLMTTVNVDSQKAALERKGLLALAKGTGHCLICCGHGAVSVLEDGRLAQWGGTERYSP
jgi:glyoxylase-like metal-dependent hydrolase (beta-lactamase superfamily II)